MTVQSTPEHDRPAPGYYPDPSIPGFVRYWDGDGWTPGSARRAPAEGEVLAPPKNARPPRVRAQRAEETGPVFLDETGAASLWTAREHVPATPITWGVPPRTEVEGIAGLPAREAGEGWTLPSGGVAEPTDVPSTAGPSDRPRPAWLEEQTGDWPDAAVFAREAASRTTTGAGSGPSAAQAGGDLTSSAVQSSGHAAGSDRPSGRPGERATGQEPPGPAPASPPGPADRDTHRGPWAAAHGLLPTAQPSAPPGPAAGGGLVPGERRNGPSGAGGSGGGVGRGADRAPDPSPSGCGELPFADRESSAGAAESRVGHPDASGPAVERSGDVERLRGGRTPEPSDGATASRADARLLPGDEAVSRHSHAPSGAWSGGGAGRGADDVPGPMGEPPFAGPEFVDGGAGSRADASPGGEAGAGGFAETGPARDERTPAPPAGGSPREAGRAPHDELPPARRGSADLLKSRPGSSGRAAPAEESGPAGQRAVGATERGARPLRGGRVPAPEGPGS
ncbi:DUF2510 domain-containing protein, partial [Streptacidiphilus monticola]